MPASTPVPQRSGTLSRRSFLGLTALAAGGIATAAYAPAASAAPGKLGQVLDYAAGVPSGAAVRAAGYLGAVRYVSQRRPGTESWMVGKPVTRRETEDFAAHGLATASVYQFGRAETADWKQGAAGAALHVPQAIALHRAAGGPTGKPIYMAIDDNPTRHLYDAQIRPYLAACGAALRAGGYSLGIYGNYNVIEWAIADGLGSYFWQHDWGSGGRLHPRAQLHQNSALKTTINGVQCDVNDVYSHDWGQWTAGSAAAPQPPHPAPAPAVPQFPGLPSVPDLAAGSSAAGSSQITPQQANQALQAVQHLAQLAGKLPR